MPRRWVRALGQNFGQIGDGSFLAFRMESGLSAHDSIAVVHGTSHILGMATINAFLLSTLPLDAIEKVTFYKRDELTTDLICCEIEIGTHHRIFHEELTGWELLLRHLEKLPNFREDWFAAVSQPPFAVSETVAFCRKDIGS